MLVSSSVESKKDKRESTAITVVVVVVGSGRIGSNGSETERKGINMKSKG